ncbi:Protein of unknown function, partial [Gryllus bimaculatus]
VYFYRSVVNRYNIGAGEAPLPQPQSPEELAALPPPTTPTSSAGAHDDERMSSSVASAASEQKNRFLSILRFFVSGLCNFLEPVPFSVCFLVVSKVNFLKSVLWTKTGNGYWILHIEVELQLFEYETASCYYWMFWGMYKSCPVLLQIITQNYGMINILAVYFHRCVF